MLWIIIYCKIINFGIVKIFFGICSVVIIVFLGYYFVNFLFIDIKILEYDYLIENSVN